MATDEIVRILDDRGLMQSAFVRAVEARDPKFSHTQLWRIQTGRANWTLDRFVYAAAALGLDPPMLLDRILRGHDIMTQLRARDGPEAEEPSDAARGEEPPAS